MRKKQSANEDNLKHLPAKSLVPAVTLKIARLDKNPGNPFPAQPLPQPSASGHPGMAYHGIVSDIFCEILCGICSDQAWCHGIGSGFYVVSTFRFCPIQPPYIWPCLPKRAAWMFNLTKVSLALQGALTRYVLKIAIMMHNEIVRS